MSKYTIPYKTYILWVEANMGKWYEQMINRQLNTNSYQVYEEILELICNQRNAN